MNQAISPPVEQSNVSILLKGREQRHRRCLWELYKAHEQQTDATKCGKGPFGASLSLSLSLTLSLTLVNRGSLTIRRLSHNCEKPCICTIGCGNSNRWEKVSVGTSSSSKKIHVMRDGYTHFWTGVLAPMNSSGIRSCSVTAFTDCACKKLQQWAPLSPPQCEFPPLLGITHHGTT
ncbi:hypothetical protein TRVL_01744 [Trypanosoma vivax]|nr:hypothetical protein TRVL_01744 [Trypanosoma vivax]